MLEAIGKLPVESKLLIVFSLDKHLHPPICYTLSQIKDPLLDLGVTLVCQSDPTWYKSDRRLVPTTTWGDLGKKNPTFDFKSTSYMALCCLPSFIIIASWGLRLSIRVNVVVIR